MTHDDFQRIDHFIPDEFARLGGYEHIDFEVVKLADQIREDYGRPLIVTRAFTEPEANADGGGVKQSRHLTGQALDLVTTRPDRAHYCQLVMSALRFWCGALGVYDDGHIHIDIRSGARGSRWIVIDETTYQWTYDNLKTVIDRSLRYS